MRALVDIPERHIQQLALICAQKKMSRAEAVRQAISTYIETNQALSDAAFGLWKKHRMDGLEYQQRARSEW